MKRIHPEAATPARPVTSIVLLLFVVATAVQTLQVLGRLSEPAGTALGLLVGIIAIVLLLAAGWTATDCYLGPGRLSTRAGPGVAPRAVALRARDRPVGGTPRGR